MLRKLFLPFFVSQFVISALSAQNHSIDSLLTLLHNDKDDTNKANHLIALCGEYRNISNYDSGLYFGNAAVQLSKQLGFKKGVAASFNNVGVIYRQQGNYDKALKSHFAALKIREEIGDKRNIANSYNNIGLIYWNLNNHQQSLEYHFKALNIKEEIGDKQGIAPSLNNIGLNYWNQGNYQQALEYYFKSLDIKQETGDKKGMASTYNNIGLIFFEQAKLMGHNDSIASERYYAQALEYYFKALNIKKEIEDKQGIAAILTDIGNVYGNQNKFQNAIRQCEQGLAIALNIGAKVNIRDAYKCLSESYSGMNNHKEAYRYYQLYSAIKDSLFNEASTKQSQEIQAKYETEKKEKEIQLLNKENENQAKQNKILMVILFAGATFIIIISILAYNRNKIKQREIMKTQMLRQQELRTQAIIEIQEQERARIARDLHDGIGQTMAGIIVNLEQFSNSINTLPEEKQNFFLSTANSLNDAYKELRLLSHQMMPVALKEVGLFAAISDLLEKTLSNTKIRYSFETHGIENISENISIGIYRILQELLSNILRHAQANTISVQLFKNQNHLVMIVEDDGIGIKKNNSSDNIKSGIGLINIEGRTKALHGVFSIGPSPIKGAVASIRIPLLSIK